MLMTKEALTVPAVLRNYSSEQLKQIAQRLSPAERSEAEEIIIEWKCSEDPLYWLRNHTLTENEQWKKEGLPFKHPFPFKPYPSEARDYFDVLFDYFKSEERMAIPKTRDMVTSWSAMGWGTHQAQWQKSTVVVQSLNEDKSKKLVGYAQTLYDNQAGWQKAMHPLIQTNTLHIKWRDGGEIFGIPAGENQIRMHHPTIVIFDEAATMPEFQQCWDAAHPVAGQMLAISSAAIGSFANMCSHE
jgi:hypothetical protein